MIEFFFCFNIFTLISIYYFIYYFEVNLGEEWKLGEKGRGVRKSEGSIKRKKGLDR